MERLLLSPHSSTDSRITMFRQLITESEQNGGDSTVVLRMFERSIASSPKDVDLAELRVAYMNLKEMPQDSINAALRYVLAIAPENMNARLSLLQTYLQQMDWQQVVEICQNGTAYNPDQMVFYYYQGLAYYQMDERDQALDAFQRGVAQINKESDAEIVADFYYFIGDILHQKDLDQQAFQAYDSCLQWKDDHIPCLNNYAYYLSVKNTDLARAEQMSYKTVKAEPKNATYLDTYAWILFMQQRYEEARLYIDQAVACDTDSVPNDVILEHAGDIYIMLNQPDTAIDFWKRAMEAGSESPMIPRKIKEKTYLREEE
jgi:tetratricopeptide (TPR) repeat protein